MGLVMQVEGDGRAATQDVRLLVTLCVGSAALQEVTGQTLSQVGLSRPAGSRQNQALVLQQQADVVQHHWLWNHRLEHQRVDALLPDAWGEKMYLTVKKSDSLRNLK